MSKKNESIKFNSIEDFYNRVIESEYNLVDEIKNNITFGGSGSEISSWENSIPDFAKLLYNPEKYMNDALEEYYKIQQQLIDFKQNIDKYNNAVEQLKNLELCQKLMTADNYEKINELIENKDNDIEAVKIILDNMLNAIKTSIDVVKKEKAEVEEKGIKLYGLEAEVFVEYPIEGKKRADVFLKNKNNWAIIELKQWTEEQSNAHYQSFENLLLQINPYVDYFSNTDEDVRVFSFIYCHNQIYYDGKIKQEQKNDKYSSGKFPYIYTQAAGLSFYDKLDKCLKGDRGCVKQYDNQYKVPKEKVEV